MTSRSYPLRIPEGVLELAALKGKEERTDRTTALRQWLYAEAEEYALLKLQEGRLTLSQAMDWLDLGVYEIQRLAQDRGIEIGATAEQFQKALKTARQLKQKGQGGRTEGENA